MCSAIGLDGDGVVGSAKTDIAKIWSGGSVQWVPESIYSVVCNVNIKLYPFDHQVCTVTYYVSDETITTVMLDYPKSVTFDEYTENSAWKITSLSKRKYLLYNTYHIDIEFQLQRRPNFATFTLIMPLLMLAFLNICVFLVPVGSGEKGSFAITIFLSYGIFVTIVSDTLPDNSLQISCFLLFIIVLLFMSVLSVVYTIIQANRMSSIGDKPCSIKCFQPRKPVIMRPTPFDPTRGYTDDKNDPAECKVDNRNDDGEIYTWAMFLEKVDVILFIIFFALVLLATSGFFSLMLQRVSEDKFSKI
ncbi:neuronal acetylcholine receptor subunit beta-4-like [Ruditapes philippinarum]|uniref:neuronal acetylcholine receptor subunit beta-4-like n=1 Tax=Ruditapes philippinarum TaxID=129788 RepID=UPI00295BE87C|nr:neuronal acetylcholine receptor subunit beta-4-like [Ruditapes philippinarum]